MVKWIDKTMNKEEKEDNSRLRMIVNLLVQLFRDRNGNRRMVVRCRGYNEKFMELMSELDIVFWIDGKYTVVHVDKVNFFRKFSKKYPLVFSSIIMREICGIDWDNLGSMGYHISCIKDSLQYTLLDNMLKDNGLLLKYSSREIDDLYAIVNNINPKMMGEVVSRQIKSLLKRYVDNEHGMICLGVEKKLFRSEVSSSRYKEKLIENGFIEIDEEEYDDIVSGNILETSYIKKLIKPGDKIDMVVSIGKVLIIVRLLGMYPPIFPSMSCFRKAMKVANTILFGSKKKSNGFKNDIKFFSFEANMFQRIEKIPFVRRSLFEFIKPYLKKRLDLIFKYMKEYPFVVEDGWMLRFLFNYDKEEDIKTALERIKEEYVVRSSSANNDGEVYLSTIIKNGGLLTNNMSKKLLMMEYSESKIIYNKINKILWMSENLDIEIGGNMNKKISYALSREDLDFRLDDIKYSLIKSFCNEYRDIDIVDAFNFFDNICFEKNTGMYGWCKTGNAKEKRDVAYYMISKKYIEMKQLFNIDLENVSLQCEYTITPYILDDLAENLYAIRKRLNLSFDWVGKYAICGGYRSSRVAILYDISTKTIVLDMRERFAMIEMHPLCQDWVKNNIANKIYICTEYGFNSRSNLEESSVFIYDPESLSKDEQMYKIYDRNEGFKYKKDMCVYDGTNDMIMYYSDGCEYATKKNAMM